MVTHEERNIFGYDSAHDEYLEETRSPGLPILMVALIIITVFGAGGLALLTAFINYVR